MGGLQGSKRSAEKPVVVVLAEASETGEHSLKRAPGPVHLVTLGIGTGIFVFTARVAATAADPAILLLSERAGLNLRHDLSPDGKKTLPGRELSSLRR